MGKGERHIVFLFNQQLLQVAVSVLILFPLSSAGSKCVLFNFGDSRSDTGGLIAGLGLYLGPPAGREFFHRTTGRFCNGRLYIDFLCESFKLNYLSPFLESSGSDFSHGVNFAVAGAAITANGIPFPLSTQVAQFLHFKNRTRELREQGTGSLISDEEFQSAIYFVDIGQNDISIAFTSNLTYPQVLAQMPTLLSKDRRLNQAEIDIELTVLLQTLYDNGARKFWVYNTGPFGCMPQTLALHKKNDSEIDSNGCLAMYNNACIASNTGLSSLCDKMSSEFSKATIVFTDMYSIVYDLIDNHTKYGFDNPLMACCGHGGPPYNYKDRMTCGQPTAKACPVGARYISWDGVHYTETANAIIALKILSAKYSKPQIKLKSLCDI